MEAVNATLAQQTGYCEGASPLMLLVVAIVLQHNAICAQIYCA